MKKLYLALFLLLSSISYSQSPCPGLDSLNYGNQWYHTVQIGSQCWLKENLNVGIMKPAIKDQVNNDTVEKFCYNNDSAMCRIYGGLYQLREAEQYSFKSNPRGLCPVGWHLPSSSEFNALFSSIGMDGNALKEIGQGQGTNTSGFSAMLSGINQFFLFADTGVNCNFWSNDFVLQTANGQLSGINNSIWNNNDISSVLFNAAYGMSVRCINDQEDLILLSPYGGEHWQVGSTHIISWGGNKVANTNIKLEYTIDNGNNWNVIINSIPSKVGDYLWIIPNIISRNCKVRISDLNNSNSIGISDSVFTINEDPCSGNYTLKFGEQTYQTVNINGRCWFKENTNIGDMIPGIQTQKANGILEKYCYNDDSVNCTKYGGLYSYSEMKERDICPPFWHPGSINDIEADVLYNANSLKEIGQGVGFGSGSNTSGFSLLLGGYRAEDGTFHGIGTQTYFFMPEALCTGNCLANEIYDNSSNFSWSQAVSINLGASVRCVREDFGPLLLESPIGGENWLIGSTQKISWTLSNVINIKIDYSTNNGTSWINIVPSIVASMGSYNWIIPNTPSKNSRVKISSTNSADTSSISNSFTIYQVSLNPCPEVPTVDYGGKIYNTIAIGDQCWMRENLNIGSLINGNINQSDNGVIEKYCYNNDTNNCSKYGGLYQWNEAMQYSTTESSNGICPTGWHIPTWNEFVTLLTTVGNIENDLLEIGQGSGTNASGFSAFLSGGNSEGNFINMYKYTYYWNSTNYDESNAFYSMLISDNNINEGGAGNKIAGISIRCINNLSITELPVDLTSFIATVQNNKIILKWNTATEINSSYFILEKKLSTNNIWQNITTLKASGNSTSPRNYSYLDKNVEPGKYSYRLKMIDFDGTIKDSKIIEVEVNAPVKYELSNAYPNPWNPTTTIRYQIPINTQVTIKVFDVLGKEVATLVNELKPAGVYEITLNGKNLSSGIYYYQIKADKFIETKKFILIK